MSDTIEVSVDFIYKAYDAACDKWKAKIRKELPDLFKKDWKAAIFHLVEKEFYDEEFAQMRDNAVLIPMPNTNNDWTFAAWELATQIVDTIQAETGLTTYVNFRKSDMSGYELDTKGGYSCGNFILITVSQ